MKQKFNEFYNQCNFKPYKAKEKIFFSDLADEAENLHFNKADTLELEESDLRERIGRYYWYFLKLININQIRDISSRYNSIYEIIDEKIDEYKEEVLQTKQYPPIIIDSSYNIIDGTHRGIAIKELGCDKIWCYIPSGTSKNIRTEEEPDDENFN